MQSWYANNGDNTSLTDLEDIVAAMLSGLLTQGTGIVDETTLINYAGAGGTGSAPLSNFLDPLVDAADMSLPQGFLIYVFFDEFLNINSQYSGMIQVGEPGSLEMLQSQAISIPSNGYFYTYLTNYSDNLVSFDNLTIRRKNGVVRAVKEYYPYGLEYGRFNGSYAYNAFEMYNKGYSSATWHELEWKYEGLDLNYFAARYYACPEQFGNPIIGRWHAPAQQFLTEAQRRYRNASPESLRFGKPMYQFDSPYNAMANNPVVNIDPDGMWSIPWGNIMSSIGGFLSSMTQTTSWVSLPFMTRNTITTQPNLGLGNVVSGAAMLLQAGQDGKKIQDAAGVMGRSMQSNSNALEQLYGNISNHVQTAWNNSFPTNKRGEVVSQEWGGIITKNTAGEYEMVDFHGSKSGSITFDYTKVPSTNEIIGDFHTHPYSPDEIEYFRKIIPNFDGLGETFSAGDFVNQGLLIKQKHIASGDQFIIMAGDVIYSAEIIDSKLAEVFFKNGNVQDALDNSQAYIDIHLDYGEASWNYLLEVQSNYEGNQPGISGVLFHRLKF